MINIHATLVDFEGKGILITGKSGYGKSDLALRMIMDNKAKLVADDRVNLEVIDNKVVGWAPIELYKKLEIRNIGIALIDDTKEQSNICLCVELCKNRDELERMPCFESIDILGISIPKINLYAFDCSTICKIIQKISGKFI